MNLSPGKPGHVYLMGAGPSDPALLTCRARQLLASCDVVAYDALVAPILLNHVGFSAELIQVGYRGHDGRQPFGMHPLVLERALAGKSVARLKSGDPAIFSRIAQEIEDLKTHGIPYEIIPGISAANAAAAYLGMPLTHRDFAADVTFASGHDLHSKVKPQSDWGAIARMTGTLVIYMGATRLGESCTKLIACGKPASTPAALVTAVGTPQQGIVKGTLADLAEKADGCSGARSPGIIVVGRVVGEESFSWLSARHPLFARTIFWAAGDPDPLPVSSPLAATGAHIHAACRVALREIPLAYPVDGAFLARHDFLAFAQPNAFELFLGHLRRSGVDLRELHGKRFVALGEACKDALACHAIKADLCVADVPALARMLGTKAGPGVLFGARRGSARYEHEIELAALDCAFVPLYGYDIRFAAAPDLEGDLVVADEEAAHLVMTDPFWQKRVESLGAIALTGGAAAALAAYVPQSSLKMIVCVSPDELVAHLLQKYGAIKET